MKSTVVAYTSNMAKIMNRIGLLARLRITVVVPGPWFVRE
jgi:hypothetical protein